MFMGEQLSFSPPAVTPSKKANRAILGADRTRAVCQPGPHALWVKNLSRTLVAVKLPVSLGTIKVCLSRISLNPYDPSVVFGEAAGTVPEIDFVGHRPRRYFSFERSSPLVHPAVGYGHGQVTAFRERHLEALAGLLVQALRLCQKVGRDEIGQGAWSWLHGAPPAKNRCIAGCPESAAPRARILRMPQAFTSLRGRIEHLLQIDPQSKPLVYLQVFKAAEIMSLNYALALLLSAGIATLGLVLNSPAVVIGATLISPLMGPILAAGWPWQPPIRTWASSPSSASS